MPGFISICIVEADICAECADNSIFSIIFVLYNHKHSAKMKILKLLGALSGAAIIATGSAVAQNNSIRVFDNVVFYDGYRLTDNPDNDLQDGILRHRTSLYAVRMTDEQLAAIGNSLTANVTVGALCDNYDRIGNINLALVPKGSTEYTPDNVSRIEIARFITPFMDKNRKPDQVPYSFQIDYLSNILRDSKLRAEYDFWVEFELFGVPYAANQQIAGCADRNDVFTGTLDFVTDAQPAELTDKNVLVPIVIKKPEYIAGNLNNYSESGTDEIGKTIKTYTFDVPVDVVAGRLVIVTSNHGANSGGEEYNRRWHYIYVDGSTEPAMTYRPGRTSCEPFRKYNTQANGIYGYFVKSEAMWQSFSNWCPGDVIDNRILDLGNVAAGKHSVTISVPDAVFADKQGDIPVSIFFQGTVDPAGFVEKVETRQLVKVTVKDGSIEIDADGCNPVVSELYDCSGKLCQYSAGNAPLLTGDLPKGIYLLNVDLDNGITETHKIAVK